MTDPIVQPVSPGAFSPYPHPYPPPPPRAARPSGCLVAAVVVLLFLLGASVLVNLALMGAAVRGLAPEPGTVQRPPPLAQKWVAGEGEAKAALVELRGIILEEIETGGIFSFVHRPIDRIRRELEQAKKDGAVKAVIFSVDSPGGTIAASDEILHIFEKFKKETGKKVVVHMGAVCASGGYYVSSGADAIVAGPTTITGSIGVILQTFNVSETLDLLKIKNVTIKAGTNKDLLNPFRPLNEEHVRIIQNAIDQAYDRFVSVVAAGRNLPEEKVRELADGRIFTAAEALRLGLADRIGYLEDALDEARKLANAPELTLVRYERPGGLLAVLSGDIEARLPRGASPAAGIGRALDLMTPRLCYLWAPATSGAGER